MHDENTARRLRTGDEGLDRRGFVGFAAGLVGCAAAALAGCAPEGRGGSDEGAGEGIATENSDDGAASEEVEGVQQGEGAQVPAVSEATEGPEARIEEVLASLSPYERVCQLFFVTPEALTGVGQAVQAGEATQQALRERPVGGLVYFSSNILDEAQFRSLIADTAAMEVPVPLWLGVDEEGGTLVARIANSGVFDVPSFPDMAQIGAGGDASQAFTVGDSIGAYLADIGFNIDFAPDADVLTNPENTSIGPRAFSSDPSVVAAMATEVAKGLQGRGVSAVSKHFPGHGDTAADSHSGEAVSNRTLEDLRACEFVPFKATIEAGVDGVMAGHISTPNAAGDGLPASLSPVAIGQWLRGELAYDGVVFSDAMNMGAVTERFSPGDAAVAFLNAGGDVVLMPADFGAALQGVLDAVESGSLSQERVDESVRRILAAKLRRKILQ